MTELRKTSKERKKEVLQAAQKIIYDGGISKLTIRSISENIGISEAALYRHFKDKEDIINKLTDLVFYQECAINIDQNKSSEEILNDFIDKQISKYETNPYLSIISFQEDMFREYPKIKEKFNKHQIKREKEIVKLLEKGIKNNLFDEKTNPKAFASIFMGSIRFTVLKWKNNDFSYSLREKLQEVKDELFYYIEGDK